MSEEPEEMTKEMSISEELRELDALCILCQDVQVRLDQIYESDQSAYGRIIEYLRSKFSLFES